MENRSFWGSGRPRAAQKPFKKVGGKAPYLFKGFLDRAGQPRTPKRQILHQIIKPPSAKPPFSAPPACEEHPYVQAYENLGQAQESTLPVDSPYGDTARPHVARWVSGAAHHQPSVYT